VTYVKAHLPAAEFLELRKMCEDRSNAHWQ